MNKWMDGWVGEWILDLRVSEGSSGVPEEFEKDVFFEHVDSHGGNVRFLHGLLSTQTEN